MEEPAEQADDYVPLSQYLDMTARLIGRIQACEALLVAMLSERADTAQLAQRADAFLLTDEASRIAAHRTDDETMQTHEWARLSAEALFANADLARRK